MTGSALISACIAAPLLMVALVRSCEPSLACEDVCRPWAACPRRPTATRLDALA